VNISQKKDTKEETLAAAAELVTAYMVIKEPSVI
jgi:hypothetical protein